MSATPFRPFIFGHRNYIRGVDFTMHVLTEVTRLAGASPGSMDLRFPRFSTKDGQFARAATPAEARDAAAVLHLRSGDDNAMFVYIESDQDARRSADDPEAAFKGRASLEGETGKLTEISGPVLFSAAIYLTKTLHERVVETSGKWIYTRFRTDSAGRIQDLVADQAAKDLEVRITGMRANQWSASDLLVDGSVVGEIFFARIPA